MGVLPGQREDSVVARGVCGRRALLLLKGLLGLHSLGMAKGLSSEVSADSASTSSLAKVWLRSGRRLL